MSDLLLRRRQMMGSVLPAGYTKLSYLESSGAQHIDLGDLVEDGDILEFEFQQVTIDSQFRNIVGGATTGVTGYFFISQTNTATYIGNISNSSFPVDYNKRFCKWTISSNSGANMEIDGNIINVISIATINYNTCLFARNSTDAKMIGRFFGFSQTRNGAKIHNLIPARRESDQELGMWDTVTKTFFTNQGTGVFTGA